jgi:hypothetical protein
MATAAAKREAVAHVCSTFEISEVAGVPDHRLRADDGALSFASIE